MNIFVSSGVVTDFRVCVCGEGGGGRGLDLKAYLPTPNILFFLDFRPLDFANTPTTKLLTLFRDRNFTSLRGLGFELILMHCMVGVLFPSLKTSFYPPRGPF